MTDDREWLFDVLWELSDKALEEGLPLLSGKLEEAMDTYLAECHCVEVEAVFQSARRKPVPAALPAPDRPARIENHSVEMALGVDMARGVDVARGVEIARGVDLALAPHIPPAEAPNGRDLAAMRRRAQPARQAPPWTRSGWGSFTVSQKALRQRARDRAVAG